MRASLLSMLLLAGCPWVGDKAYEEQLLSVDDDLDGSPASEDCDDHDGTVSPAKPEVWYDGVDERCDGRDDYDQDLDGYVPDAYAGLATTYVDGSGALPGDDCDDLLDTVNPAATDDWYDGVDTDCGGEDDFDMDGDGFVSEVEYPNYTDTTYVDGSGRLPNGDCDDADAAINPSATDTWYDGIDSDCADDDDYDQDLDGFDAESGGGDDCDDLDPTAYPDGTEVLGDSLDSDCDGRDDSFSLASISGFTWLGAAAPVFAESDSNIYLSVLGDEIDTGSTHYYDSALALVWANSDPTDGRDGVAAWAVATSDQTFSLSEAQGFVADSDYLYGALGYEYAPGRSLRLIRYDLTSGSRTGAEVDGTLGLGIYEDITATVDDQGGFDVAGCDSEEEILHFVRMPGTWSGGLSAEVETEGVRTADCALAIFDGSSSLFASQQGTLWEYSFDYTSDSPTFSGAEYSADYAPLDIEVPSDWDDRTFVMADATSDSVVLLDDMGSSSLAVGDLPVQVDADQADDGTIVIAWIVPGGDVFLGWGDPRSGYSEVEVTVPFAATDVAVHASGDYVLIAATSATDVAVGIARR